MSTGEDLLHRSQHLAIKKRERRHILEREVTTKAGSFYIQKHFTFQYETA